MKRQFQLIIPGFHHPLGFGEFSEPCNHEGGPEICPVCVPPFKTLTMSTLFHYFRQQLAVKDTQDG
jgi:hypothetical protein